MRSRMSFQSKRELLAQVAPPYHEARRTERSIVLSEFVAVTGYDRKYAIRLLARPLSPPRALKRPRERVYGPAVQEALGVAWAATNYVCAKRLVPFLPELIPALERHDRLALTPEMRIQLLALSAATADRLLRPLRQRDQRRGLATTKAGRLLKRQIPIRTFADWNEAKTGFLEVDLVAHCGGTVAGTFLSTLVLTDVATGWTECQALRYRSQETVIQGLDRAQQLLPMPMLGLDTDNGSEFINADLLAHCQQKQLTFTRGRAYRKNDQCYVEQKNGVVVRQFVGYTCTIAHLRCRRQTTGRQVRVIVLKGSKPIAN
jgi:Integrase core domain